MQAMQQQQVVVLLNIGFLVTCREALAVTLVFLL